MHQEAGDGPLEARLEGETGPLEVAPTAAAFPGGAGQLVPPHMTVGWANNVYKGDKVTCLLSTL